MSDDKTIIKPRPGKPPSAEPQDDRTIIKPRPAGQSVDNDRTIISPRRRPTTSSAFGNTSNTQAKRQIQIQSSFDLPGLPLLVQQASSILSCISQLKQLDGSIDVEKLRLHLSQSVTEFSQNAKKHYDQEIVEKSSYALCATLDEAILNTPWGENSAWSQKPLLSVFHRETYGGEKFYSILESSINTELKPYDLLELLYLCLSLGFLGKLRIDKNGEVKAEKIRSQTYQTLVKNRNRYQRSLSSNINPIALEKNKLYSFLPVWILASLLILSAFGIYNHWLLDLNHQSDQTALDLAKLIPVQQEDSLPDDQIRKEVIYLKRLLAQEINQAVLTVNDYHNRSAIILNSNELFTSGSAEIDAAFHPILDKISKALETLPGRIIVSGHTDNIAIRTARYPSNWHLSLARASAVGKYMSNAADLKARLLPEGRGESEPITDNQSPEGRAKNRRVTIELFYTDASSIDLK